MEIFDEAHRLYGIGFSTHWLHKNSKRPIENNWSKGPRKSWDYLRETYIEGLNVGVLLGTKVGTGWLCVIDCDVKSTDQIDEHEMNEALKDLLGDACGKGFPVVKSGRGNGSSHVYCLTKAPQRPFLARRSEKLVRVTMPSVRPSKRDVGALTPTLIDAGVRMRPAWEISVMGEGQQVVLPPSVHPDSKLKYEWVSGVPKSHSAFPLLDGFNQKVAVVAPLDSGLSANLADFAAVPVDMSWLQIPQIEKDAITKGIGVEDRSAYLMRSAFHLFNANLSKEEILSVLTEPSYALGKVGYEHRQTKSREKAAAWVWKYSVKKFFDQASPEVLFKDVPDNIDTTKLEAKLEEFEGVGYEADWRSELDKTKDGKIKNSFGNAVKIAEGAAPGCIGLNQFSNEFCWLLDTPWGSKADTRLSDADSLRFKEWAGNEFGVEFPTNTVVEGLARAADKYSFHPVREWLESLEWDGKERISTWLKDFAGAKAREPYLSCVSKKTLVAMVKRVMEPGCKFDQVLIMEGKQEAGKSSLANALAGEWFTDEQPNIGDKDAILNMTGKWLIELGELSVISKTDLEQLKAFISRKVDRIRPPYGRLMQEYPRQSVFVGTTNNYEYLKDLTGNRRFWPVKVSDEINWKGVQGLRDQLFAEAFACWQYGETVWLDEDLSRKQAALEQTERIIPDEWASEIRDLVEKGDITFPCELRDVARKMAVGNAQNLGQYETQRISRILRALGYASYRSPRSEGRKTMWKAERVSV